MLPVHVTFVLSLNDVLFPVTVPSVVDPLFGERVKIPFWTIQADTLVPGTMAPPLAEYTYVPFSIFALKVAATAVPVPQANHAAAIPRLSTIKLFSFLKLIAYPPLFLCKLEPASGENIC